ncbi:MAG: CoA transferase, partial [Rhodoferax sp.]|nr:CoA transferase [Rhodoferax sp.]
SPGARDKHVNERLIMTQEVLKQQSTAHWMQRLEAFDVPCSPALKRSEVINHPQVLSAGCIVEVDHHAAGRLRQARSPAQFDKTPSAIRFGAPLLGEHNEEILKELGYSSALIRELHDSKIVGSESISRNSERLES